MQTSLRRIANKAAQDRVYRFQNLYSLLTASNLNGCWRFINKKSASGVDRVSASDYEAHLNNNTKSLADSVKRGWYRAKLVLRKYIPKLNGKMRPLGIPAISDKLLEIAVKKILEAIYEEDFYPNSYGYRPGTGAHKAIKDLSAELRDSQYNFVVEADIKGFFDNIDHNKLLNMLMKRIDDKPLLKLIRKWLKAGVLDIDGMVIHPATGYPQGGIVSPILANIYLHYALDVWFEEKVKVQCKRNAYLCRYADDFVCTFVLKSDADRFYEELPKRLALFGLEVAPEMTFKLEMIMCEANNFEKPSAVVPHAGICEGQLGNRLSYLDA